MSAKEVICFLVAVFLIAMIFSGCASRVVVSGACNVMRTDAGVAIQCTDGGRAIVE